jgi:hypothetical protein
LAFVRGDLGAQVSLGRARGDEALVAAVLGPTPREPQPSDQLTTPGSAGIAGIAFAKPSHDRTYSDDVDGYDYDGVNDKV